MKQAIRKRDKMINFVDRLVFYYHKRKLKNCLKLVKKNSGLKDSHKGETCYIFGNGPSVKNMDLSMFSDKFVFTVNQLARNPHFSDLKSNIHFWADPQFFELDLTNEKDKEVFNVLKTTGENGDMLCFYPAEFKRNLDDYGLGNRENSFFFLNAYSLSSFMKKKNRYDSYIPAFYTVVQYAVFLANYMGFSKIYLFGCEMTAIITVINARLNKLDDANYGYAMSDNEKQRMVRLRKEIPCSTEMHALYKALDDYDYLNDYCEKHGSKLFNCTPNSIIDSIEKCSIEDSLKNN